jgi:HEAT repeat protein
MFQAKVKKALAEGVRLAGGTDEARAPYVTAAGIGRAEAARPYLLKILANKHRQPFIRGHAARALGVLGRHDDKAFELLIEATRDRVHPLVHAQAARALGMLGAPGACEELLLQLHREGVTRGAAVAVTLALGRVGDFRAVYRLVRLAEEESAGVYVRTMAVVALGLIYDPETPPSRALLRTNANYMNMTWSLRSILDIL